MRPNVVLYNCRLMQGRTLVTKLGCETNQKRRAGLLERKGKINPRFGARGKDSSYVDVDLLGLAECEGCPGCEALGEA